MNLPSDVDPIGLVLSPIPLIAMAIGLYMVGKGFWNIRLRKMEQDLATSRARSIALGPVELKGKIIPGIPTMDPIYAQPSAYYNIIVEHLVLTLKKNSIGTEWVQIHQEKTDKLPFWVKDETGKTLVWAPEAEYKLTHSVICQCGFFGSLFDKSPEVSYLRRIKNQRIFIRSVRYKFRVLRPDDQIYVLGYAVQPDQVKTTNPQFASLINDVRNMDKGRVVTKGDGEFIISESEQGITEDSGTIGARILLGLILMIDSAGVLFLMLTQTLPSIFIPS